MLSNNSGGCSHGGLLIASYRGSGEQWLTHYDHDKVLSEVLRWDIRYALVWDVQVDENG